VQNFSIICERNLKFRFVHKKKRRLLEKVDVHGAHITIRASDVMREKREEREREREREQGKRRVLRAQKEGSSGPMRNHHDGSHFNDRDKQREEEKGAE